ncbi:MAG: hypothetical protein GY763_11725 [Gammaproteobacteria bacterium]|nr:hypothetical protein [Gammaproteobacteria bacterium]
MTVATSIMFLLTIIMLGIIIYQVRYQRMATETLLNDNRIRTRLYQDADESTTFILSRTIQNVSAGNSDPSLESDSFSLQVIRELVKRRVPKERWLEIQTNERLVHEVFLLLRPNK